MIAGNGETSRLPECVLNCHLHEEYATEVDDAEHQGKKQDRDEGELNQ
jgi:hypothetical protein